MNGSKRRRWCVIAIALIFGTGFAQESADSQLYRSARYAIVGTEIDVSLQQGGISNYRRRVILRLDTQTGTTNVLQLAQSGVGNPTVKSAVWAPVAENGNFLINNNLSKVKNAEFDPFFLSAGLPARMPCRETSGKRFQ